jgi:HAD superfamily phosphoserine phosphatase-like hydrolase
MVFSDLDGTLTETQSSWQFVMESFGLWESKGKHHLRSFLNNEISYDQFIHLDTNSWKGKSKEDYLNTVHKIKFRPGVKELFHYFSDSGAKVYLISSGLMDLAVRAKKLFPVHEIYANEILKDVNGFLNGKYRKNVGWNDNQSKRHIVERIIAEKPNSIPIIALGDSSGDIPLIDSADLSFACYSSDTELNRRATYVINEKNDFFTVPDIVTKFLKQYNNE